MLFNAIVDFLTILSLLYLFHFQGRKPVPSAAKRHHTQQRASDRLLGEDKVVSSSDVDTERLNQLLLQDDGGYQSSKEHAPG